MAGLRGVNSGSRMLSIIRVTSVVEMLGVMNYCHDSPTGVIIDGTGTYMLVKVVRIPLYVGLKDDNRVQL